MSGNNGRAAAGGGAIYALGIFGAWAWFWQQADTFWGHALAVLQGLFWPAFMVYDVSAPSLAEASSESQDHPALGGRVFRPQRRIRHPPTLAGRWRSER